VKKDGLFIFAFNRRSIFKPALTGSNMKRIFFRTLLLCIVCAATALSISAQVGYSLNTLSDGNGNPILSKKGSTAENQFLFNKEYLEGVLYLGGNEKAITGNKFKLDLQNSKLYFLNADNTEMEVGGAVKRVALGNAVFEKGFPAVDKLTKDNFYQVLVDGKALLLMDTKFEEISYKEYNSATTTKRTDKLVSYYGVLGNRISRLLKPEDALLLLTDKTQQVSDFMKKENIRMKKQGDLERMFAYYNSLQ